MEQKAMIEMFVSKTSNVLNVQENGERCELLAQLIVNNRNSQELILDLALINMLVKGIISKSYLKDNCIDYAAIKRAEKTIDNVSNSMLSDDDTFDILNFFADKFEKTK